MKLLFILCGLISTYTFADYAEVWTQQDLILKSNNDQVVIVDVRTQQEFQSGRVPGALNIPVDQIEDNLSLLSKEKSIVLYCQSGRRASIAEGILTNEGYKNLIHLDGDMAAWREKGLPLEK